MAVPWVDLKAALRASLKAVLSVELLAVPLAASKVFHLAVHLVSVLVAL